MKNVFRILFMFAMIFAAQACCERIDVGHAGIKVNLAGSSRGAQDAPLVSGWVWYSPFTEDVIEFPTSMQNVTWSAERREGSNADESITFTSSEGVSVNADVGFSYHIVPEKAGRIYTRFRADVGDGNLERVSHGFIRNVVRDVLNETASRMPIQDIYGARKTDLLNESKSTIDSRLREYGFVVDQLTFTGALRLPQNVQAAINNAMEATQRAIQQENQVRQTRAQAEQAVVTAHGAAQAAQEQAQGEAQARLIAARADAEAMQLRSEAEAAANRRINESLTPRVLQFRAQQRWNGVLPQVMSGSTNVPFIMMQNSQASTPTQTQ